MSDLGFAAASKVADLSIDANLFAQINSSQLSVR